MLGVIIVGIAGFSAYVVHAQRANVKVNPPPRNEVLVAVATEPNLPVEVAGEYFEKKFILKVGGYQDFMWRGTRVRIDVKEISKQTIPRRHAFIADEQEQATIRVNNGGGLVYGGEEASFVDVNVYRVPAIRESFSEPRTIYFFQLSPYFYHFFCLWVDHINPTTNEVTLNAAFAFHRK